MYDLETNADIEYCLSQIDGRTYRQTQAVE